MSAAAGTLGVPESSWPAEGALRQENPERWMMPAQVMTGAITMGTDGVAKFHELRNQLVA